MTIQFYIEWLLPNGTWNRQPQGFSSRDVAEAALRYRRANVKGYRHLAARIVEVRPAEIE